MTFFYDLNKKLDGIREKPETTHKQLNERDMSRAAKGYEKYGKEGMEALAKAGREGKALDPVRNKYDKYDEGVEEGLVGDTVSAARSGFGKIGDLAKRGAKRALDVIAPGDEELLRRLQKDVGVPQTGKKPGADATVFKMPKSHEGFPRMSGGAPVPALPKSHEGFPRVSGGGAYTGKGASSAPVKETGGTSMSPKQKSFAALAPPTDKITFADKIAGAKKEVDEMLGDVAADAMKKALGGGRGRDQEMDEAGYSAKAARAGKDIGKPGKQFAKIAKSAGERYGSEERGKKVAGAVLNKLRKGGVEEASDDNAFTAHKRPRVDAPKVGTVTHGRKHDVEEIPGGRRVTRRVDPQGISVGADDEAAQSGEKRGRGRPKGPEKAPERVTGGATKHKGGRKMAKEGEDESPDLQAAIAMLKKAGYEVTKSGEEELEEKAVSKKQQKFMGMVHATQKGEKAPSKEVAKVAREMPKKAATDFASTKHKGLPEKAKSDSAPKKKEKTEEAGGTGTPTASSGFSYGKGIYDSLNRDLESMISEGMNVNMSMNTDAHGGPSKSLTVTATDEDAVYLGKLLKMAGLGSSEGGSGYKACGCGQADCSCGEEMDEAYGDTEATKNTPDYPTNTETSHDALQYSGGLNKPKSTGQTTTPVIASQDDRQHSYAEEEQDAIARMMEMAGVKKKAVEEEKTEEGNKFTGNLAKARAAGKTQADLDGDGDMEKVKESIFDLTSQWKAYKG